MFFYIALSIIAILVAVEVAGIFVTIWHIRKAPLAVEIPGVGFVIISEK